MSLKFTGEGHLNCVLKHSVVIVVILECCLIVGVMVLTEEVVGDGIES